jgi:hypothetical protein
VSDWLVPVSRHVRFEQPSGNSVDTSFDALQDAALNGRLAKATCDARGPLFGVGAGDVLWFYTDDLEAGVFAVGRARKPTKGKLPTFVVMLDKTRTRVLASDPLPAPGIRRWVPELRQGAVALGLRPRAQTVLEAWDRERGERDAELLRPIGATPWRAVARTAGQPHPARDEVYGPIARLLRSQDFAVGMVNGFGSAPWLVGRRVRDVVTIDVERIKGARVRDHALAEFGPLRDFRWRIERDTVKELRLRTSLWMAFVAKPPEELTDFLEDEDVLVSWQQRNGTVELTDRSKQRWYQYLGVR